MKQFRSAFVFVLALSLLFGLCACNGSNTVGKTTEAPEVTTEAPKIEDTTEVPTETKDVYRVKVVDETGNPIVGAMVQMCLETCFPGVTNADGVAEFGLKEADYKVTFMSVPAGYTYSSEEQEFYFEDGSKEMTIILKKQSDDSITKPDELTLGNPKFFKGFRHRKMHKHIIL